MHGGDAAAADGEIAVDEQLDAPACLSCIVVSWYYYYYYYYLCCCYLAVEGCDCLAAILTRQRHLCLYQSCYCSVVARQSFALDAAVVVVVVSGDDDVVVDLIGYSMRVIHC